MGFRPTFTENTSMCIDRIMIDWIFGPQSGCYIERKFFQSDEGFTCYVVVVARAHLRRPPSQRPPLRSHFLTFFAWKWTSWRTRSWRAASDTLPDSKYPESNFYGFCADAEFSIRSSLTLVDPPSRSCRRPILRPRLQMTRRTRKIIVVDQFTSGQCYRALIAL